MSEVANLEAVGSIRAVEHLLQADGIGIAVAIAQAVAISDAVAHAGDAQGTVGGLFLAGAPSWRRREAEHHAQENRENGFGGHSVSRFHR